MDSHRTHGRSELIEPLLYAHLKALTTHRYFRGVFVCFMPECNYGNESIHMEKTALKFPNVDAPTANRPGYPGIQTSDALKEEAAAIMKGILARGNLYWMKGFIVANPYDQTPEGMRQKKMREETTVEFAGVRAIWKEPATPFGRPKCTISGKCDGQGRITHGKRDDRYMAASMAVQDEGFFAEGRIKNSRGLVCK